MLKSLYEFNKENPTPEEKAAIGRLVPFAITFVIAARFFQQFRATMAGLEDGGTLLDPLPEADRAIMQRLLGVDIHDGMQEIRTVYMKMMAAVGAEFGDKALNVISYAVDDVMSESDEKLMKGGLLSKIIERLGTKLKDLVGKKTGEAGTVVPFPVKGDKTLH